ncbi:concanavalin A-like lectin/glucanase domain-containing protein [Pavlovales sp. CCMP2436]|nr:concanavalin A-like lectin/glucanase domain-containing protein [Pavlovales sp. CCMP2436]
MQGVGAALVALVPLLAAARVEQQAVPAFDRLSFQNPFSGYPGGVVPGWTSGGDAFFAEDYIALTPPAPGKIGWVWSDEALHLNDWEARLEFHIGGVPARGAGGGLAFWLTSHRGTLKQGEVYGHDQTYEGLGIFFDSYEGEDKSGEPFVVAMVNHGKDLSGEKAGSYSNQLGVCFANYRNKEHAVHARIRMQAGVLSVALDLEDNGDFSVCITTSITEPPEGARPQMLRTRATMLSADVHKPSLLP